MALEPRKSDASRRATAPPEHRDGASRRGGRLSLAIHEDTRAPPAFLIELPMLAAAPLTTSTGCKLFGHRRGRLSLAIHENTRAPPPAGYAIRRKDPSADERHVLRLLRGFSMGAGVLPPPPADGSNGPDGELTYMRARVERVIGSKDSEALYVFNPDDDSPCRTQIIVVPDLDCCWLLYEGRVLGRNLHQVNFRRNIQCRRRVRRR